MNRFRKIIRNIIILVILIIIYIWSRGLFLSPITAHEFSERSIHYGPSEVIHIEDFDKGKFLLCKYDKWVSCNTVKRELFFFWRYGNQPIGFENDKTKPVDYSWSISGDKNNFYYRVYGIINDDKVKKIELTLEDGEVFTQTEFYDNDLFLFTWKSEVNKDKDKDHKSLKGYDADNNLIFEGEY